MPRRSKSYDEAIAKEMQDHDFARGMVLHAIEQSGYSIEEALQHAIQSMGIKEFSDKSGLPLHNISDFVNGKRKFGFKNISRCLAVFGLRFVVARDEIKQKRMFDIFSDALSVQ